MDDRSAIPATPLLGARCSRNPRSAPRQAAPARSCRRRDGGQAHRQHRTRVVSACPPPPAPCGCRCSRCASSRSSDGPFGTRPWAAPSKNGRPTAARRARPATYRSARVSNSSGVHVVDNPVAKALGLQGFSPFTPCSAGLHPHARVAPRRRRSRLQRADRRSGNDPRRPTRSWTAHVADHESGFGTALLCGSTRGCSPDHARSRKSGRAGRGSPRSSRRMLSLGIGAARKVPSEVSVAKNEIPSSAMDLAP